jgi:transcriptional regulator with XRE-family HTH domain
MDKNKELPTIDEYVGNRIRSKRILLGMDQKNLANKIGVSYQQIQKYEAGSNCLNSQRLYRSSLALEEPISYFFNGLPGMIAKPCNKNSNLSDDVLNTLDLSRENLELIRLFYKIEDPSIRKGIKELLKNILNSGK